jgi:Zn-dependent peptidase ImmA (M78 family)
MQRGFKASAERLAQELRERLGSGENEPASLEQVAVHLDTDVLSAGEVIDIRRLEELNDIQADAFSAATFKLDSGKRVIVYNPLHEEGRTNSNVAHELAHILLEHTVRNVETVGSFKFLTCDSEQEEEADWLAGCLLLPRPILYASAKEGMGPAEIAERYRTSEHMARFRLNLSGVLVQVGRQRKARR